MSLAQQIIQNSDQTFFLFSSDKISMARVTWEFIGFYFNSIGCR